MTKDQVKIGNIYLVRMSTGRFRAFKIEGFEPPDFRGRKEIIGICLETGTRRWFRSAAKLRTQLAEDFWQASLRTFNRS